MKALQFAAATPGFHTASAHIGSAIGLALMTFLPFGARLLPDLLIAASYAAYAFLLFC